MGRLSERVRSRLEEEFDTAEILQAVDALDEIRLKVEGPAGSEIRARLLDLHALASRIINEGAEPSEDEEDDEIGDDEDGPEG